jgi:hypothetical protein
MPFTQKQLRFVDRPRRVAEDAVDQPDHAGKRESVARLPFEAMCLA